MKKYFSRPAYLMTAAVLMVSLAPAIAANVDVGINIGIPGGYVPAPAPVYVQPRPVYVQQPRVYAERDDEHWKCKNDKCKLKKDKRKKHHKDD